MSATTAAVESATAAVESGTAAVESAATAVESAAMTMKIMVSMPKTADKPATIEERIIVVIAVGIIRVIIRRIVSLMGVMVFLSVSSWPANKHDETC